MSVIASPSIRKLAMEKGIDLDELAKKLGREQIAREDLEQKDVKAEPVKEQPGLRNYWDVDHELWGEIEIQPIGRIPKIAIDNLTAAHQTIPVVTHHDSADVSRLEKFRDVLKKEGKRITPLAFHVAILSKCLKIFPKFNASISSDGKSMILKKYVNISIAVDTEVGLLVPVIRNADKLTISQISEAIVDLAGRARNAELKTHDMGGASMTISSLGGIGGEGFTPIVNPPEVAILGLTKTKVCPVWNGSEFIPTPMAPIDLTYDHRLINGADAARFVNYYIDLLKSPAELILDQ